MVNCADEQAPTREDDGGNGTHSTRLAMRGEDLQRLVVAERDENLDTPLSVIVVLAELDLSKQAES